MSDGWGYGTIERLNADNARLRAELAEERLESEARRVDNLAWRNETEELRAELAAERERPQDLTWFWEIVDRDALVKARMAIRNLSAIYMEDMVIRDEALAAIDAVMQEKKP